MARKKNKSSNSSKADPPSIKTKITQQDGSETEFIFRKSFRIGRGEDCEIQVTSEGVSRHHAEVTFKDGYWWLKDLNSANGTYVLGRKIESLPIGKSTEAKLGLGDVTLTFTLEQPTAASGQMPTMREKAASVTRYIQHYFDSSAGKKMGEHTRMIHQAYKKVQRKQKLKYFLIIGIVVLISIGVGYYSYRKHQEVKHQKVLAEDMFYAMKTLELELAKLKEQAKKEKNQEVVKEIDQYRNRQSELSNNYDHFLEELDFYSNSKWSEKDSIIFRIARIFGECELAMPADFKSEIYRYIKKWRTTDRLSNAMNRARQNGYAKECASIMLKHDLPPQFFYLALQESDFNIRTIGPRTRFGIAKGIWQFIPATAMRYGLRTGPLLELPRYDPRDERFNFKKATHAAARYIRDIYNTEAQASGLLVIASYNWGERNVRDLIRQMPHNPRERNFWRLFKLYGDEIPRETYNYVFYIFSAAVIGENPDLFGFEFDNPLQFVEAELAG